jgi:hypothetical protein
MYVLDHIRAVEDQRLMAAPGQPVVVFEAQLKELKRRSHASVEDDDTFTRGCQVVPHRPILARIGPTLTQLCEGYALCA